MESPYLYKNVRKIEQIPGCLLTVNDLKALYEIVCELNQAACRNVIESLQQGPEETDEHFNKRKENAKNAFKVYVSITDTGGTFNIYDSEAAFKDESLFTKAVWISFDNTFGHKLSYNTESAIYY